MAEFERYELRNARALAHEYMERLVRPGDSVCDATMGNGGDTVFLAQLVGETGKVYAIDVQQDALRHTQEKVEALGLSGQILFSLDGHQNLKSIVQEPLQAVMFNLGWLPGGDHSVTTHVETTLAALEAAADLLCPGGLMSICVYPGHEEGSKEREAVGAFCRALPVNRYTVLSHQFVNARQETPLLFLVQKNLVQPKDKG